MNSADAAIAEGVAALNAGAYPDAAQRFMAAIRAAMRNEQAWLGLAMALALGGRPGDLPALADQRQASLGDGFLFFHAALGSFVGYRLFDLVRALDRSVPETSSYAPSLAYHAGCAAVLQGDETAGFADFARFKRLVAAREGQLPIGPESHFNIAYRQGMLIEDRDYTAALGDFAGLRATLPPADFAAAPELGLGEAVIATACDRRYFRRFAPGLVQSAVAHQPGATLHFHVVAADDESRALFAALRDAAPGLHLNLSSEPAGPYSSAAYYASNRFLTGPALIARYRRPLVLTDVDIEFAAPLDDLLAAAAPYDFAGFRHDGAGPCSRYPAVLTLWRPSPGGLALLDRVGRFVLSKLAVPWPYNWMLDQAALASTLRWARLDRPEIALGIFNDLTGRHFQPWLRSVGGEEKSQMIRSAG